MDKDAAIAGRQALQATGMAILPITLSELANCVYLTLGPWIEEHHMLKVAWLAGSLALAFASAAAAAPLLAPSVDPGSLVSPAAGGCGIGFHRGPYGGCRPNRGYYGAPYGGAPYVAPYAGGYAAPYYGGPGSRAFVGPRGGAIVCPPGFHLGPDMGACWPN